MDVAHLLRLNEANHYPFCFALQESRKLTARLRVTVLTTSITVGHTAIYCHAHPSL